jgi:ribose 5-phosphate isomerase A
MNINELKRLAAEKAVEEIESGMIVGLGSGSTFKFALERISQRIKTGELKNILGIPSSIETEKDAIRLGIPLTTLDEHNVIDLDIDGADEVDENLNLIKGGGGKLLREKILAQASKRFIVIVDETKLSQRLGTKFYIPVEVIQFALTVEKKYLESLGARVSIRKNSNNTNYITDENNFILDSTFGSIENVNTLAEKLSARAGIVEHGLFIGMTSKVICAMSNGEIFIREKTY